MPNKPSGFRLYLQVRIGKALRTDEAFLTTYLDGREVRIRASLGPSISKAEWLVFEARGFPTESEAHTFGERLRANGGACGALCQPWRRYGTGRGLRLGPRRIRAARGQSETPPAARP